MRAQPKTPLSGVRSSCDTTARNSSFARFARSASSRAPRSRLRSCRRSSSMRRRSVMSRAIFEAPTMRPVESLTGDTVIDTSISRRSRVMRTVSKCSTRSPRRSLAMTSSSSARRSSGTISVMGWPIASAAVQPNIRSAAGFHEVITPFRVLLTITSSDDSTMAASRARISSKRRRSVMSLAILQAPTMRPVESFTGETVREMWTWCPSFVTRTVSKWSTTSPPRTRASTSASSRCRSGGMIRVTCRPSAAEAGHPYILSAAWFQDVMIASSVSVTMASSDASTMAARRAAASPVRSGCGGASGRRGAGVGRGRGAFI